jgi:hypothetical protein
MTNNLLADAAVNDPMIAGDSPTTNHWYVKSNDTKNIKQQPGAAWQVILVRMMTTLAKQKWQLLQCMMNMLSHWLLGNDSVPP